MNLAFVSMSTRLNLNPLKFSYLNKGYDDGDDDDDDDDEDDDDDDDDDDGEKSMTNEALSYVCAFVEFKTSSTLPLLL